MPFPAANRRPPFDVTRASHAAFGVADIGRSLAFYEEVIGLVLTERIGDSAYLRGVEEDCHHSLVLHQRSGPAECEHLGFRVRDDDDLEAAAGFFRASGLDPQWVDIPFQRRTLWVRDPQGVPLEFVASMVTVRRLHSMPHLHRGATALRFDHSQVRVPDAGLACEFYASLGFVASDYSVTPAGEIFSAFLHRKDNPHDIVFASHQGPCLHHFAYIVDGQNLMRAGDVATSLGQRRSVEYGPSRHGQDHASFVYLRDPDGHRIELLSHPIQIADFDSEPICRNVTDRDQFVPWGPAAPTAYQTETSRFPGEALREPLVRRTW